MRNFLLFLLLALPTSAWAKHAIVNCGPIGYWSHKPTTPSDREYVLWINNDDTAELTVLRSTNGWIPLGQVGYGPEQRSLVGIPFTEFKVGDMIFGNRLKLTLVEEIEGSNPSKRSYFLADFLATDPDSTQTDGQLECEFGLK